MLWSECSRSEAVRFARQALTAVKPWSRDEFPLPNHLTLSIGLATLECGPKTLGVRSDLGSRSLPVGGAAFGGGFGEEY